MTTLRCFRCHRPIKAATKEIPAIGGDLMFGPKCAEKAGLRDRERVKVVRAQVRGTSWFDPLQIPLDLGQPCA
jgi:hypothetical protein